MNALTVVRRFAGFIVVGWLGFIVQLGALAALMFLAGWTWLPATVAAVELAIVHNFFWHERVTWNERTNAVGADTRVRPYVASLEGFNVFKRFLRYNAATGLTSIGGNALLMALYVGVLGIAALPANALAVGTMSAFNFIVADRWVFRALALVGVCTFSTVASAAPSSATVAAWEHYVAQTETRLDPARRPARPAGSPSVIAAEGSSIGVDGGTISDWRGAVFIPGVTLDEVLERLRSPGTPPPQEDVLWSRVIARGPDSLRVFIRLVRHAIITATYDTEHEMAFRRWTPTVATARSVATRIEEIGGHDRGFLWRLHSYWRYEQIAGGVWVDLRSLTLSRTVPWGVRTIASPIVSRIARESMTRTLDALRRHYQAAEERSLSSKPKT